MGTSDSAGTTGLLKGSRTGPGGPGGGSEGPGGPGGSGGSGDGPSGDGERLVELTRVGDEVEGQLLVGMLHSHGVPALLSGVESAGYRAVQALSRPRVMVRRGDLTLARDLLEVAPPDLGDAPWSP